MLCRQQRPKARGLALIGILPRLAGCVGQGPFAQLLFGNCTQAMLLPKGIVRLFESRGESMLIQSVLINWRSGKVFLENCNDTISREEHETILSGLRIRY